MPHVFKEFIGVYDADATLIGELTYWLGARFGVRHCSLCDITHGLFTERSDWIRCRESLRVPITTYHRNDAPPDVLEVVNGAFPCVVARGVANQSTVVLGPDDLEALDGSPEALVSRLNELIA
jgi:hypothetical protein